MHVKLPVPTQLPRVDAQKLVRQKCDHLADSPRRQLGGRSQTTLQQKLLDNLSLIGGHEVWQALKDLEESRQKLQEEGPYAFALCCVWG